jgi:hypothetical protein
MGTKTNMSFFKTYIELDKACAARLGIERHGVSAYISKLVDMRFAPGRSEVLPKLIKYRNCRNTIAHEENAMKEMDAITKSDIQWINYFIKCVNYKRDPISRYESKARRYAFWKKFRIAIIAVCSLLGAAFVLFIVHLMGFI